MKTEITREMFDAALNAAGVSPSNEPRIERDGIDLYECFDDAAGNEVGFVCWRDGVATFVIVGQD